MFQPWRDARTTVTSPLVHDVMSKGVEAAITNPHNDNAGDKLRQLKSGD